MLDELQVKTLKLLADPCKLKIKNAPIFKERFKTELEYKFNTHISTDLYTNLLKIIEQEIIIDIFIKDIINQVMINHNP